MADAPEPDIELGQRLLAKEREPSQENSREGSTGVSLSFPKISSAGDLASDFPLCVPKTPSALIS